MEIARKVTLLMWEHDKQLGRNRYVEVPAFVEMTIDIDRILAHVGGKALKNKTGKSSLMSGLIRAKARRRAEETV